MSRAAGLRRAGGVAAALVALLLAAAPPARAHEFWIAPERYSAEPGAPLAAALRVGIMLKGEELPYLRDRLERFELDRRGETRPVEGLDGDFPALALEAAEPGLTAILYRSAPDEADFADMAAFRKYLDYEGLGAVEEEHRARGLPETGITESYRRTAKALVQVGPVTDADRDRPAGLPFELVALDNPYAPGQAMLRVALLSEGRPAAGWPVAVHVYDGEVRRRLVTTDAAGEIELDVAGGGFFLLNAVELRPGPPGGRMWQSEWASLTFGLPIADPPLHPLDPLTKTEIILATRAIGRSGRADAGTRVALLTLDEPEKAAVLGWRPGEAPARRAFAVLRVAGETVEAVVDLETGELAEWTPRPGMQPAISPADWALGSDLVKSDPRWLAAMAARGLDDPEAIFCEALSAGHFGPAEEGRRLMRMPCYNARGARTNPYGRPVEGVTALVDLDREEVVEVIDTGPVPVAAALPEFGEAAEAPGPAGPAADAGFRIERNLVEWGPWAFHLGFDGRFGPVLSLVTHRDGAARRSVLYQGHLSEIFVPYMDADPGWYFRSYMDAGEYGIGAHASPLVPGLDCPAGAAFLDAVVATRFGQPETRERVVCVFEREGRTPLWRHRESLNGLHAAGRSVELVVRSIPSVGNYDYAIDWVFDRKGEIAVQVGATGIDAVKGVAVGSMAEPGAAEATSTGMLVAPNLVAVHHDHHFAFRLDLDVDGVENSFRRARLVPGRAPEGSPRRSLWRLEEVAVAGEGAVGMAAGPELWRVESTGARGPLGHAPSYQIEVHAAAPSLLDPDDPPQRRAAFAGETLWITRARRGERMAAGPYPNQHPGGAGLPEYADGESIVGTDVVAWATIGFHHLTRPEDWPVLPTVQHELRLRPYGFFARNPGLDLPEDRGAAATAGAAARQP